MDGLAAFMAAMQKQEAAEAGVPDPDFDPAGHLPTGQPILCCLRCACVVADTPECREIHLVFHRQLDVMQTAVRGV